MSYQMLEFRQGLAKLKAKSLIEPCLPVPARKPPSGPGWFHEIKHDGYRIMVRKGGSGVSILTRNGHDWTSRFPLIASAANALRAKSFLIDGEAVACERQRLGRVPEITEAQE